MPIGSSPHTRGAPKPTHWTGRRWRIIPAYAGSTSRKLMDLAWRADHPRIRGEHDTGNEAVVDVDGSSPHTRGAHPVVLRYGDRLGIIPAYAGSTREDGARAAHFTDHPRIRGEHVPVSVMPVSRCGSSPHTRGAPHSASSPLLDDGIIPAYAGSTCGARRRGAGGADHPRIRGEHGAFQRELRRGTGSSPHTRGARGAGPMVSARHGIIPAYAGSTRRRTASSWRPRDHPRIRGEHAGWLFGLGGVVGSSPHTRGARLIASWWAFRSGIIPAYAGST